MITQALHTQCGHLFVLCLFFFFYLLAPLALVLSDLPSTGLLPGICRCVERVIGGPKLTTTYPIRILELGKGSIL